MGKRHGLFPSVSNYTELLDANVLYAVCCGIGNGGALLPISPRRSWPPGTDTGTAWTGGTHFPGVISRRRSCSGEAGRLLNEIVAHRGLAR